MSVYILPESDTVFVQQNIVSSISGRVNNDSIIPFVNQRFGVTKINDTLAVPLSTEIGLNLNHYYDISFGCDYYLQSIELESSTIARLWYCGGTASAMPFASHVMHPKISLFVGAGQAAVEDIKNVEERQSQEANFNVLVIKPMLEAEVNVANFFVPAFYVGYRLVLASDYEDLQNDATGAEIGLALKFVF